MYFRDCRTYLKICLSEFYFIQRTCSSWGRYCLGLFRSSIHSWNSCLQVHVYTIKSAVKTKAFSNHTSRGLFRNRPKQSRPCYLFSIVSCRFYTVFGFAFSDDCFVLRMKTVLLLKKQSKQYHIFLGAGLPWLYRQIKESYWRESIHSKSNCKTVLLATILFFFFSGERIARYLDVSVNQWHVDGFCGSQSPQRIFLGCKPL